MKKILFSLLILIISHTAYSQNVDSAYSVIKRVVGEQPLDLKLKIDTKSYEGETYFKYSVEGGVLSIEANSPVALCKGFYDYVKSNHFGIVSWSGSNVVLPQRLEDCEERVVISPFKNHYMSNVVVYGYSMPYWDWERWSQEIDWMALHGVDMPLALVASEAIYKRVWGAMGLTDEEINSYFTGAAHLPWMRMGNISNVDGPLNNDWHQKQLELQHKILDKMRALGMKPITPGFAGFIPPAFKRIYPDLELVETHWGGAFNNWMISPENPLFSKIGTAFIREYEREFGRGEYYLIDSFNEMEIPFPEKGSQERYDLLASYGDKVYSSIKRANPKAKWAMQGWMFGYQRDIWDYETLEALLSKVPDDKALLLDLSVDYNKHFWHSEVNWDYYKGFYNKPWVYSVIPNMGGKTGMTGILEFYANGHLEALNSENRGQLLAHGAAPEGIENNEVIYELLFDAGWSDKEIDLGEWLKNYSINRYKGYSAELDGYWEGMLNSVYGTFTDHPRYRWQLRPGLVSRGSININGDFFKGIESFIEGAKYHKENPLYMVDLAELTALYLGGKAEILLSAIDAAYDVKDAARAEKLERDFEYIMLSMDGLLEAHPNLRLERWLEFAKRQAVNSSQERVCQINAKRIVTVWGPPVDDYSARVWSGLIRDYYLPRWRHYFASRKSGEKLDYSSWESNWVEQGELSESKPIDDIYNLARSLVDYTAFITPQMLNYNPARVGVIHPSLKDSEASRLYLPADMLSKIMGLSLKRGSIEDDYTIAKVEVVADGVSIFRREDNIKWKSDKLEVILPITTPSDVRGNNGVELLVTIRDNSGQDGGDIVVEMVLE